MSWHYLQGTEAASWADACLDGAPSALLRLLPTGVNGCCNDKPKDTSNHSRSGMTLRRSTGGRGAASLMWYQGDFPVRTYLPRAVVLESLASAADCGPSSPGSLAKYNPVSYGWKTAQCLLDGDLESYSETFPRWGMTRDGELFPLPTPSGLEALRVVISRHSTTFGSESGSGQRAPTPIATEGKRGRPNPTGEHPFSLTLTQTIRRVPTPRCEDSQCAGGHRDSNDTLYGAICRPKTQRVQTCMASESRQGFQDRTRGMKGTQESLTTVVSKALRLPTAHGFSKDGMSNGPSGNELGRAVNRLPTVTRSMVTTQDMEQARFAGNSGKRPKYAQACPRLQTPTVACATGGQTCRGGKRKDEPLLAGQVGGSLNPDWVEWLHGWPIGWTASAPLETDKFQQWLRSHGA